MTMLLHRCFICTAALMQDVVRDETADTQATSGKYAFDPERGRLWVVCGACGAWNLVPIEARWEAIEAFEKLARDHGHVLARTDNIALIEAGDVSLIRVGRTERREEAWWRYLKEAEHRRENARRVVSRGKWKDAIANLLIFGVPVPAGTDPETWINGARYKQFSNILWQGRARCSQCGDVHQAIGFADSFGIEMSGSELKVFGRCCSCDARDVKSRFELGGSIATRMLQRKLAHTNYAGGSEETVDAAVRIIDGGSTAASFVQEVAAKLIDLRRLAVPQLIALEMAVNESREHALLAMEARALEARWKQEEEIAFIVDRELTPPYM